MICSGISKLFYIISRACSRGKLGRFLKYHEWYLRLKAPKNHAIATFETEIGLLIGLFNLTL